MENDTLRRIEELENWKKSLESSHSIPLKIDQSFKARFSSASLKLSSKQNNSETETIDEAGSATVFALGNPDAFLEIKINETTYYVPVFT